ncbi:MAG: hypothetical protein KAG66_18105, partial [Methylococcales bacterium]|nr:hypothetical protein [Methylococcales bacterium]
MKTTFNKIAALLVGTAMLAKPAMAQDSSELVVEGEMMTSMAAAPAHMVNVETLYSGWRFRSTETQALQLDDFENPAMIAVDT